jgi:hypothetical protein
MGVKKEEYPLIYVLSNGDAPLLAFSEEEKPKDMEREKLKKSKLRISKVFCLLFYRKREFAEGEGLLFVANKVCENKNRRPV